MTGFAIRLWDKRCGLGAVGQALWPGGCGTSVVAWGLWDKRCGLRDGKTRTNKSKTRHPQRPEGASGISLDEAPTNSDLHARAAHAHTHEHHLLKK